MATFAYRYLQGMSSNQSLRAHCHAVKYSAKTEVETTSLYTGIEEFVEAITRV